MSNPKMPYTDKLSNADRMRLCGYLQKIMTDLPMMGTDVSPIRGVKSMAQELITRIETISKNNYEFMYLTDAVTALMYQSKGAEIEVFDKMQRKVLTKEEIFKYTGIFLNQTKKVSISGIK